MNEHGESDDARRQDGSLFLFPGATHSAHTPDIDGFEDNAISDDEDGSGNEVVVTTVLEATRPLDILMTPILVKIAQEVSEAINRYVSNESSIQKQRHILIVLLVGLGFGKHDGFSAD